MGKVILKAGADLKRLLTYILIDTIIFLSSVFIMTEIGVLLPLEIVFDISFILLIIFLILVPIIIKSGRLYATDEGVQLVWFRKVFIPWNNIKSIELKANKIYYSPLKKKFVQNYSIQIITVDDKIYEMNTYAAEEVAKRLNEILNNHKAKI
jgi:hypothetical protein